MEKTKEFLKKAYRFSNSWTGTVIIVLLVIFFVAQAFVIPSGSMISTLLIGDHLFVKKFSYGVSTPRLPWVEIPVFPDSDGDGHLIEGDKPRRADIVIFRFPENDKIHYVKRCVAVGGDEVIYTEKNLYIRPLEGDEYIKSTYPQKNIVTLNGKLFVKDPYAEAHKGVHYDNTPIAFEQMILHLLNNQLAMEPVRVDGLDGDAKYNAFYIKIPKDEFFMMGDNRDHSNDSRFWGTVPYKYIIGKPWFIYFSWDDDYIIRWNRIGKRVETLESEM